MTEQRLNRRRLSLYLTGGAAALALAGCSSQQIQDTSKQVADIIQKVQQGVRDACEAATGLVIPTALSVVAVLSGLLGTQGKIIAATADVIAEAIKEIAAIGCPAPVKGRRMAGKTPKGVDVEFY